MNDGTSEAVAHWNKIRNSPEFKKCISGTNINIVVETPLSRAITLVRALPPSARRDTALLALEAKNQGDA
jgi:hypothetical protein